MHYLVWTITALLYSPVFFELYKERWEALDYTHAYFILPISILLAYRKYHGKFLQPGHIKTTGIIGVLILVIGLLLFILGWRMDYLFVSTFSLIPVVAGLVLYLYGARVLRQLAFPILYLLLLVPVPLGILDAITLPMRYGVSTACAGVLSFFKYPVIRNGLMLTIGKEDIFMGAPCSGFRSLITMLSLGLVYVYLVKHSLRNKLILVLSIVPLALVGNLVRTVTVCLLAYYFGGEVAQGFFHGFSGVVIFLIMIGGLLGIEKLLEKSNK